MCGTIEVILCAFLFVRQLSHFVSIICVWCVWAFLVPPHYKQVCADTVSVFYWPQCWPVNIIRSHQTTQLLLFFFSPRVWAPQICNVFMTEWFCGLDETVNSMCVLDQNDNRKREKTTTKKINVKRKSYISVSHRRHTHTEYICNVRYCDWWILSEQCRKFMLINNNFDVVMFLVKVI